MQVGVNLPLAEIGADLVAVRDFVQAAEALGYAHVKMRDHILGSDLRFHPEIKIVHYSHETYVHEPFTLMAYLAAITEKVQLVTGILILPLRQTALVAKQAAEVDVLSGGRLRLGIGVGWNPVEFQALGQDFQNRGKRVEEQIDVLRALWTQEIVNFNGPVAPDNLRWLESPSGAASDPHMDGSGSACESHSSRNALTQDRAHGRRLESSIRSGHSWARGHPTYARLCQGGRT